MSENRRRGFIAIFLILTLSMCGGDPDQKQNKGNSADSKPAEYIFGYWSPDGYYYGARVLERSDQGVRVLYEDGTRRLVNEGSRGPEIPSGAVVEAMWKDRKYYALKSWKQEDMVVHVVYKDDIAETVSLEQIRFKLPDESD